LTFVEEKKLRKKVYGRAEINDNKTHKGYKVTDNITLTSVKVYKHKNEPLVLE
jgi:hypothetical protein